MSNKIHLAVTCTSYMTEAYGNYKRENASKEILKFTRTVEVGFPAQCGLYFSAFGENFRVQGFAERMSMEINFQGSVEHSFCDSRITYLRKHRKELRKKYAESGWKMEVIKEADEQYR